MADTQHTPKTVIITGGNGFVGKHLQAELQETWSDANVIAWDLPEIDITKPETYQAHVADLQPDWIVHLAAIASVPAALKDPHTAQHVNVEGTRSLLDAIQRNSQSTKVLFVSTADIYGQAAQAFGGRPIPELPLADARPNNPYAESKLAAERIFENKFNDRSIRVRPFPHIGPGQGLGFVTSDFASQIASIETGKQPPVIHVGNLEAARDFTDVRDVVRAYRLLMEVGTLGQVYHVASGVAVRIQVVLHMLLAMSSADINIKQDPNRMRPSDTPVLVGDADKLVSATNWKPGIALKQSLQDILFYWRSK